MAIHQTGIPHNNIISQLYLKYRVVSRSVFKKWVYLSHNDGWLFEHNDSVVKYVINVVYTSACILYTASSADHKLSHTCCGGV